MIHLFTNSLVVSCLGLPYSNLLSSHSPFSYPSFDFLSPFHLQPNYNYTILLMHNFQGHPIHASPSHKNPSPSQPSEHLQRHISQLTLYINQNNQKYHKNMVTLKEFYQQQQQQLSDQKEDLLADNSKLDNQVLTLRDILANCNLKNKQLEEMLRQSEKRQTESRGRFEDERKRSQGCYDEIDRLRQIQEGEIEKYKGKIVEIESENHRMTGELYQRQNAVDSLTKNMCNLQQKVNQNYLLPDKLKDLQKDKFQSQLNLKQLNKKHIQLNEQLSFTIVQLKQCQSENEALKIHKANASSQSKLELEQVLQRERESASVRTRQLEKDNQNYIYLLNQSESKSKVSSATIGKYENEIVLQRERERELKDAVDAVSREKNDYLAEFGSLKVEYQAVIQRLEDALIQYQNKHYTLEEENKDLNSQLESLQELLLEVKGLNQLQINKPEYRRLAELELLAREKPLQPMASQPLRPQSSSQSPGLDVSSNDEWQKLMKGIEAISS